MTVYLTEKQIEKMISYSKWVSEHSVREKNKK